MNYKDIFYKMNGGGQLFFFCFIFFFGFILFYCLVASVVIPFFADGEIDRMSTSIYLLRITQVLYVFCTYLAPPILFAYLFEKNPKFFFVKHRNKLNLIILTVILIISVQPFIYLVSYYNEQISLPDSMSKLEQWMMSSEMEAERVLNLFLGDRSTSGVILNILIISVLAGIAEELFFRGALQQILNKIIKNEHLAIWTTAIIFSAIHLQFYGFIPRVLLGALLGYLFLWSGNIFLPILAHILHNLVNLLFLELYYGTSEFDSIKNPEMQNHIGFALISLIVSLAILYFLHKKKVNIISQ